MVPVRATNQQERRETPSERADRNFGEVLQELRVAQTGVQILFAFLLTLGFLAEFPRSDRTFVAVLTAALLCAGGSSICFLAPVAFHRRNFRQGRKDGLVWLAHWLSLAGLGLLVATMTLSLWLVVAFLWSPGAALVTSLGVLVLLGAVWAVGTRWLRRRLDP
jgi:hypothetical protein